MKTDWGYANVSLYSKDAAFICNKNTETKTQW